MVLRCLNPLMGLREWLSRRKDHPFVVGETYYNEDFDGRITVTSLKPFRVEYEGLPGEKSADLSLYTEKFHNGIIRKL